MSEKTKAYKIKELFYTLQGEGKHSGRPAVFCRFAGCNLWSGREADRAKAICRFCDTDFRGTDGLNGGHYKTADALAEKVASLWPKAPQPAQPYVVCTGGEPLIQLDQRLIRAFQQQGFEVAVETNGTIAPPAGIDWLCVSPKANTELLIKRGDELKLVYPQEGAAPELYEKLNFDHFFLQPMFGEHTEPNTRLCLQYCLSHPQWKLSLQIHKILGIP